MDLRERVTGRMLQRLIDYYILDRQVGYGFNYNCFCDGFRMSFINTFRHFSIPETSVGIWMQGEKKLIVQIYRGVEDEKVEEILKLEGENILEQFSEIVKVFSEQLMRVRRESSMCVKVL
jgi:hypothetical protein